MIDKTASRLTVGTAGCIGGDELIPGITAGLAGTMSGGERIEFPREASPMRCRRDHDQRGTGATLRGD